MKCDKYMGMDVHQATTVVAVLDAEGKVILETMVATEAQAVIRLVQSLSHPLHVTFEETTQAALRQLQEIHRATHPAKLEREKRELIEAIAVEDDEAEDNRL